MLSPTEVALARFGFYVGLVPTNYDGAGGKSAQRVISQDAETASVLLRNHYAALEAMERSADEIEEMIRRDGGPDAVVASLPSLPGV